ncbi:MAG: hemerythrin domain-containing protein [Phenylobacterium sp.]|uniref:hemerythrin domain-containing protein n=1 Tax=Phenylobacterium sp. TaxID=1871053 RepID=UPI003918F515
MTTRNGAIEPIPPELIADPLNFFFAEHYRHRQLCRAIDELAAATFFDAERISEVVDFLRFEAPVHIIDEEEDLFPLLRRRCLPEDELEGILGELSAEHKADGVLGKRVRTYLEACLEKRLAPGADLLRRGDLTAFAAQERRHLALENAIVLPIARLRLSPEDLCGLSRRLAARRGRVLTEAGA